MWVVAATSPEGYAAAVFVLSVAGLAGRWVFRYQNRFLDDAWDQIEALRRENEHAQRANALCEWRNEVLRRALMNHGIPVPDELWGRPPIMPTDEP